MKDVARFIEKVYGLSHVVRWNFHPTIRKENVAEHSFYVSLFATILAPNCSGISVAALLHDTEEAVTADLPALVKRNVPMWHQVVTAAEKELVGGGDDDFFDQYMEAREYAETSRIIKIADLFSALMYAREEKNKGNTYFARIERELIGSIVDSAQKLEIEEAEHQIIPYSQSKRVILLLEALGFDHTEALPRPVEMSHLG